MDQCQTDDKLGIDIKDEVGEKCEVHGKKPSKFFFAEIEHPIQTNYYVLRGWNWIEAPIVQ